MFRIRSGRVAITAAAAVCGLALALAQTAQGDVRHFGDLDLPAGAARIAGGPDGALWFTLPRADRIGRITTEGRLTLFEASSPLDIAAGPGGLWYTAPGRGAVGRITTTGAVTEYAVGGGSRPWGIAGGPDGAVWFTRAGDARIGRVEVDGDAVAVSSFGPLAGGSLPLGIAGGGDGALWFSDAAAARLGRLTTSGELSEAGGLSGPTLAVAAHGRAIWTLHAGSVRRHDPPNSEEFESPLSFAGADGGSIAAASNGQVWVAGRTVTGGTGIARVMNGGTLAVVCTSPSGTITDLAFGSDSGIWFVDDRGGVGRLAKDTAPGADCGVRPDPPPAAPSAPPEPGPEPQAQIAAERPALEPRLDETVVVDLVAGRVTVTLPGTSEEVPLEEAREIPVGSLVNAAAGRLRLTSAANAEGGVQSAEFRGARFKVRYARGSRMTPVTELVLRDGPPACRTASRRAVASAKPRRGRALWGSGKGRFRTRGRYSSATVRGTTWMTLETCAGTLVKVRRGKVAVRDFSLDRTVLVRAGRSYLARPRR